MTIPPEEFDPQEIDRLSPARRRRARRRLLNTLDADERASYIETIARRASPSFDFFLFSLLSGAILGVALLIDSPYLILLGVLLAPLMTPVVGISVGTILGAPRQFGRSLGGLAVGSFLVLLVGALAGFAARIWLPLELLQARLASQLAWPPFIVIGIGAVLTAATMVREKYNPAIPSVSLAYGLYLPLSAAGFGLGSGEPFLWPDGVVVYAVHLSWAAILGAITLGVMGFRPQSIFGYSLGGAVALLAVILIIAFGGAGAAVTGQIALPTAVPTNTSIPTPTQTGTATSAPPSGTPTPSSTVSPTTSLTPTISQTPTPVQAIVQAQEGFTGVVLRDAPNGTILLSLLNGTLVQYLPDEPVNLNGAIWVKVVDLETGTEGWILESLLVTATPPAGAPTLAATQTPAPQTLTPTP
jgi:uncharacterized membrane protein